MYTSFTTYPWVCTDTAVQSSIVASDGKSVDKWLRELWRLLEVAVIVLWCFHLQACGGKGKGMGLCKILKLSGIMWETPFVMRERQCFVFLNLSSVEFKGLSVIPRTSTTFKSEAHFKWRKVH